MHLENKQGKKQAETRAQLKDDAFLREIHSRLKPGIENSERRFDVHKFTCAALALPDFSDFVRLRPLIDALIAELNLNDFLGCTAALEMLAETAATAPKCVPFFGQIGLLDKVYALFSRTKEDPDMGIIHIACIRFFAYLCTTDANALTKFPKFTADVFDAVFRFDAFDVTRRQLAFETLAVISSTSGAKQILSQNETLYNMKRAISNLAVAVATTAEPSLKARHLEAVRMFFDRIADESSCQPEQKCTAASAEAEEQLLHRWFRWLGEPFPRLLLQCVRDPISEVQLAALRVLMALTRHQWAYAHFCALTDFVNLLVDRSVNFDADAMQLKYALICRLVEAAPSSLDDGQMEKLRDYCTKGPFWGAPVVEVATEEAA
ncbi:hypothetical protein niasHT_017860 [Heterodera trifolii]|uniref:26S proteasome non-ATPase regulatory subunit 5 n=1 Tax=Heterodera trifolii TaxID=157864 RepID=A0ABD2LKG7_9BILA